MRIRIAAALIAIVASTASCSGAQPATSQPPLTTSQSISQPTSAVPTSTTSPALSSAATPLASPAATSSTSAGATPTGLDVSAGYADLPGWIVFEHFGQAPDGSTSTLDFHHRMIWLVHANGSGLHELAAGKPVDGKVSPDISPDGSQVAFSSYDPLVRLWEAPIEGGDPVLISTDCSGRFNDCQAYDPAYSADGKKLAFVHFDGARAETAIAIRDLSSGQVTYLKSTAISLSRGYLAQPSWSPDGKQIVYYRSLQPNPDEHVTDTRLFVVAADDSAISELPQPLHRWAADPDWSPDGSLIVFSSAPNRETEGWADGPTGGIYTIRPDGTDLRQVCTTCLNGGSAPSWTPDGEHILFWGYRSWALMDRDGGRAAHINQAALTWFGDRLGFGYAAFLQPTR